jgi:hypothetical protein
LGTRIQKILRIKRILEYKMIGKRENAERKKSSSPSQSGLHPRSLTYADFGYAT